MFVSTPGLRLAGCCRSNRLVDVLSRWQMSSDPAGTLGLLTHRGEHQPVSGSSSRLLSYEVNKVIQRKLNLADTSLAEKLGLKDTLQKIWATVFDF